MGNEWSIFFFTAVVHCSFALLSLLIASPFFCVCVHSFQQVQSLEQELLDVNIERDCLTSEMHKLANRPNRQQRDRIRKNEIEISLGELDKKAAALRSQIKRSPGRPPNVL